MSLNRMHRRAFTVTAAGFAAGVFAARTPRAFAQDATPAVDDAQSYGYASTRIHTLESADARGGVNDQVLEEFIPEIEALDGFAGYVLGDVIDDPDRSISIVVFDEAGQVSAFDEASSSFISELGDQAAVVSTDESAGDLLMLSGPAASDATPESEMSEGYLAFRFHTSLPGTDPREFVPLAMSGFLPIVEGLPGFQGYLWYPTDDGFVAISLFDSEEAAEESNEAAREWAEEYLPEYTDGNPEAVNAHVVYANLPVLGSTGE